MKKLVEKLISGIKGEKYALPEEMTSGALIFIVFRRGIQVFRGLFLRMRLGGRGLIFCGKGVSVRQAKKISAGGGLILEDYVCIDALCKGGVHLGRNVTIGRNTVVECTGVIRNMGEFLTMGDCSALGAYNYIGVRGPVSIGKNTILRPISACMPRTTTSEGWICPFASRAKPAGVL